ncbi:hypothetical protein LXL04_023164 [Taraxacum kok-saghyz]
MATMSVIGDQFIAKCEMDLIVEKYSCGNFLITDIDHNILLKVKQCNTSCHRERVVLDIHDKPILMAREKIVTGHNRWNVFKGDSKSKKDKIFSIKKSHIIQFRPSVDVFLKNKNGCKEVYDFQIKGSWSKKNCTVNMRDTSATIAQMCKMESPAGNMKFVNEKCMVKIYPNVDYAFVVTLMAIVEAMDVTDKIDEVAAASVAADVVSMTFPVLPTKLF